MKLPAAAGSLKIKRWNEHKNRNGFLHFEQCESTRQNFWKWRVCFARKHFRRTVLWFLEAGKCLNSNE